MSEKQALVDLVTITSALPADCFSSGRERCSNQYHAAANTTNNATAKIGFRYRDSIIPRINSHSAPPPVHATVHLVVQLDVHLVVHLDAQITVNAPRNLRIPWRYSDPSLWRW